MSKKLKNILTVILALVMALSLASCSKPANNDKKGSNTTPTETSTPKESKNFPDKLENPNVSWLYWGNKNELEAHAARLVKKFEEKYGGEVNVISVDWGEMQQKLAALVASNDAPDIALGMYEIYQANLFQPIDPYLDLNDKWIFKQALRYFENPDGTHYALPTETHPIFVYWNKKVFENAGVKTPKEYYDEGNWNYDTFFQSCQELAQDTNNDGKPDIQGAMNLNCCTGWTMTNGQNLVDKVNGKYVSFLEDPRVIEAIEIRYKNRVQLKNNDQFGDPSKSGMYINRPQSWIVLESDSEKFKANWDIVPIPKGPSYKGEGEPCGVSGFGIPKGSKNPEGAATFIYWFGRYMQEETKEYYEAYNDEQVKMIQSLFNGKIQSTTFTENAGGVVNPVLKDIMTNGMSVQAAIDKHKEAVNKALSEMK